MISEEIDNGKVTRTRRACSSFQRESAKSAKARKKTNIKINRTYKNENEKYLFFLSALLNSPFFAEFVGRC
jgi:hypothetical protein